MLVREFYPGLGQAVAERTILRKKDDGKWETWGDVADRVALGNSLLCPNKADQVREYQILKRHISKATILTSGRHLQHGDADQPTRNMEVHTNCSTACSSFSLFYLLLNGSGVGRSYDDDLMIVNWDNSPTLICVLDETHADFDYSAHESSRDARHKYGNGKDVLWYTVEDTREGWAKALEVWENSTFEKIHKDKLLILDFSKIRPKGSPIKGMQNRPASGPVPLMNAFKKAYTLKGAGLDKWMQAIYIDHYFAECVLVGGARRAARMSTKFWKDKTVLDFITVKRPIEYTKKSVDEIVKVRNESAIKPQGFLWSSNNSILVDDEFWDILNNPKNHDPEIAAHAKKVFNLATSASYGDGTGEPGFINVDKLIQSTEGLSAYDKKPMFESKKYKINEDTELYLKKLFKKASKKKWFSIVNPCGEIVLALWGGFCVLCDLALYFADTLDEAEDACRAAVRAMIRVNLMDSVYKTEVERTNRIGIALTGVHEFAWKFFKLGFRDLIDENKSQDFWMTLGRFKKAIQDEAESYSKELGVNTPMTDTTIKPSGTISKLFGLTEGWHLPAMAYYVRWVQFSKSDPLVEAYRKDGYPVRELVKYQNTVIVGFPTVPLITTLGMGDKIMTAPEATPEEQYKWILLGEKYWLRGVNPDGTPLAKDTGNQISYTLKYDPSKVDFKLFTNTLRKYQPLVKCCSVMPAEDGSAYEYLPEEPVTKAQYEDVVSNVRQALVEDVDFSHIDCKGGACPIDFNK